MSYDRLSIFLVSLLALCYQILLLRILSHIQSSYFVSFVISLAMLGIGVSGIVMTVFRKIIEHNFYYTRVGAIFCWGGSSVLAVYLLQYIPLNPQEILWSKLQFIYFLGYFILPSLPFLFSGIFIGSFYLQSSHRSDRLYFLDLIGAAIGSLVALLILECMTLTNALSLIASCCFLIAFLQRCAKHGFKYSSFIHVLAFLALNLLFYQSKTELAVSPYKSVSQTLLRPNSKVISHRTGAWGSFDIVESSTIPFRYAPGLSLNFFGEFPKQLGIFLNGDTFLPVNKRGEASYYESTPEELAYKLTGSSLHSVLILGEGGGTDIDRALKHGAREVTATINGPALLSPFDDSKSEYTTSLFEDDRVNVAITHARSFLAGHKGSYDLIQIPLQASLLSQMRGGQGNYLLTTEGMELAISKLSDSGLLMATRWLQFPPRDSLRLFSLAHNALSKAGKVASKHLILLRSLQTSLLVVSKREVSSGLVSKIKEFAVTRSFDLVYYPGISSGESNRFNIISPDYFYDETQKIILEVGSDYFFNITPPSDNAPFFHHFLTLKGFHSLLSQKFKQGVVNISKSYTATWISLIIAFITALIFILIPTLTKLRKFPSRFLSMTTLYFSLIGLAYLIIEIIMIGRLSQFLSHPIYSVSFAISSFLASSCLGSFFSIRMRKFYRREIGLGRDIFLLIVTIDIILWGIICHFLLAPIMNLVVSSNSVVQFMASFMVIFPLGFMMGIPFPIGIEYVGRIQKELVPFAYGVNSFFSVISALVGVLLIIHNGFSSTLYFALILYGSVGLSSLLWMK